MSNTEPKSQLQRIEEYFGASAHEWRDLYAAPRRVNDLVLANRRRLAVQKIREHAASRARILDAGCGAGLVALDLVEHGFFVHGVDIARSMLDLAEERFRAAGVAEDGYAFTRADVTRAGLSPASFGGVVALGFLEYQDDELVALGQLNELLAPGGILVVSGPTERRLANYLGLAGSVREWLLRLGVAEARVGPVRIGLHRYGVGRFRTLLEATGFELIECRGHGFVEFEGIGRRLSYGGELALHQAFSSLAQVLPIHRFGNDMVAVARKRHTL